MESQVSDSNAVRIPFTTFHQVVPWHRPNPLGSCFLRPEEGQGKGNWYLLKACTVLGFGLTDLFIYSTQQSNERVINYPHHPPGETEAKRGWSKLLQPTIAPAFTQIGNGGEAGFERRSTWHQGPCSASYPFILTNQQREKTEWSPSPTPLEFCHIFQEALLAPINEPSHSVIHT